MPGAEGKSGQRQICLPAPRRELRAAAFGFCTVLAFAAVAHEAAAQERKDPLRELFGLDAPSETTPAPEQRAPSAQPAVRPVPSTPSVPLPPRRPASAAAPVPAPAATAPEPEPAQPQPQEQQKQPLISTPFGTVYRPLGSSEFVPFSQPEPMPLQPKPLHSDSGGESPAPGPAVGAPEEKMPSPVSATAPDSEEMPVPAQGSKPANVPLANVPLPPPAPPRPAQQAAEPPPVNQSGPVSMAPPSAAVPPPADLPPASTLTDRQIVERANRYFNATDTLQANFTQLVGGSQRTTGMLYLERPGRIRFTYNPPSTMEIISDGKNVAIRDSKLNTSDVYSINQTPLKFLLRDPINLASDLKVIEIERDPTSVQVTLEDASTIGGKAQITLFFDSKVENLTRWQIIDAQGFRTTIILSQVKRARRGG